MLTVKYQRNTRRSEKRSSISRSDISCCRLTISCARRSRFAADMIYRVSSPPRNGCRDAIRTVRRFRTSRRQTETAPFLPGLQIRCRRPAIPGIVRRRRSHPRVPDVPISAFQRKTNIPNFPQHRHPASRHRAKIKAIPERFPDFGVLREPIIYSIFTEMSTRTGGKRSSKAGPIFRDVPARRRPMLCLSRQRFPPERPRRWQR